MSFFRYLKLFIPSLEEPQSLRISNNLKGVGLKNFILYFRSNDTHSTC